MDLYLIWRLILRHLPIVLIASMGGLSLGLFITVISKPLYSATSTIFVSTPAAVLDVSALAQGSNFTQQRVKSYAQLISAEGTLAPVIELLKLETTPEKLAKRIRATVPIDTVIIDVTVKDESPQLAMDIANAVALSFSNSVQQLELPGALGETSVKASLSRQATYPEAPVSPKLSLNILLGVLLGFIIGLFISILIHFGDLTVKNIDHLVGLKLLGTFKFEKNAKTQPLISNLHPYDARTEEFRQLRTSLLHQFESTGSRIIGISSALPLEGKTTTSINIAHSLQEAGYRVILIEADMRRPQISQYTELKVKGGNQRGLSGLLQMNTKKFSLELRKSTFSDSINNIDIIFSGDIPKNPTELLSNGNLPKLLAIICRKYDFVIFDCPPVLPIADTPVLAEFVDDLLLVVKAGATHIKQFKGTVETLQSVNARIVGVVLNMIPVGRKSDEYGYQYGAYRAYGYNSHPAYAPRDIDLQKLSNLPSKEVERSTPERTPRYAPKSERTPRYAPKSERTPRYAPKSERTPRYAPKSERTPRYAPRDTTKSSAGSEIDDEFDRFVNNVLNEKLNPNGNLIEKFRRIFKSD